MVKINKRITNLNWELESIFLNQVEVLELKNTIFEITNSISDMSSMNFLTEI